MSKKITTRLSKPCACLVAEPGAITVNLGEGEDKGPPTFSGVAYSGGIVSRGTLSGIKLDADYIIDLKGMKPCKNPKVNLDHKPHQRVGHFQVEEIGSEVKVSGVISAKNQYSDEVESSASRGFPWDVSIEASLTKPRKLERGKSEVINGRKVDGPLYIFPQSTLTGLGFVSNGADEGNSVSVAASAAGVTQMNEFEKFAASLGVDLETASDEQKANLQSLFDAQRTEASDSGVKSAKKTLSELAKEVSANQRRVEEINTISVAAMKEHPMFIDQIKMLGEKAIELGTSPDMYELELIRATRSKAGQFTAQMRHSAADPKVIEAAICMSAGVPNIEKHYSQQTLEAVDAAGMRNNFSVQQLLLQVANQNGYTCRAGERINVGNLRTILEYCFPPVHARMGFSTVTLPGILGNVANKMILAGYMEEDRTWEEIATVKNVSNFYTHTHFRMLDDLEYEEVGSGGEIPHGTIGQEYYTSKAKTYGKMLGLTREQIINDDLGAFDDIRERLGRGAAQKFNNVFWLRFMSNLGTLFPTDKSLGNYIDGAGSALGVDGAGLQLGITAFRKLRSPSADGSKRIGFTTSPTKLLVPPESEFVAQRLYQSTNVNTGGAASAESVGNANIHAGRYRPIVQNRLSDTGFTGNSNKMWFLFGDTLKPMIVTFLNGNRTPVVESSDADFNTLGIQFRGYHDFGCDPGEKLAGIMAKGEN